MLEEGCHIAFVSDAACGDSGAELAAEAAAHGIPVVTGAGRQRALSALSLTDSVAVI